MAGVPGAQVTYASLMGDLEEFHAGFEGGLDVARRWLDGTHGVLVDGEERFSDTVFVECSPIDRDVVVGTFSVASDRDVADAVGSARAACKDWSARPYAQRCAILLEGAAAIVNQRAELAALCSVEVGKSRLEALGEIEEAAEFIRYYAGQMAQHEGYTRSMAALSAGESNLSRLRPCGVWLVISPFNFPAALCAGPVAAALITGNTVVAKPSSAGALTSLRVLGCLLDAGLPDGVLHVVTGPGDTVGAALLAHHDIAGITFTGSRRVGMQIYQQVANSAPKPVIGEMGGKNPVIVAASADPDLAAEGVARAAFGYQGQKCSAASRVYVDASVYRVFLDQLVERTAQLRVGDPTERDVFCGPVIDARATHRFEHAVAEARLHGTIHGGGHQLTEGALGRGHFVEPTIVELAADHPIWSTELFLPFVALQRIDSFAQALALANASEYGLTAGLYSTDNDEIDQFLNEIQAGVIYVNRRAGATTGAWPGSQPFGGWKGSGTTGRGSGGPWYLPQYLREQSQTVLHQAP